MARVITVLDQKGGVGKTTVACHIAFAVAERGQTALAVDLDTQGNMSQVFTGDPLVCQRRGGAESLFSGGMKLTVTPTELPGLSLLHGHAFLEEVNKDPRVVEQAVEMRSKVKALGYDYIVCDTPPSIGSLQGAPMFWSDLIIVPVEPTPLGMSGLPLLMETVRGAAKVNPSVMVRFVANKFFAASKQQKQHLEGLRQKFGRNLVAELPLRVAVADALAVGEPVWKHGSKQVRAAWKEFTRRVLDLDV